MKHAEVNAPILRAQGEGPCVGLTRRRGMGRWLVVAAISIGWALAAAAQPAKLVGGSWRFNEVDDLYGTAPLWTHRTYAESGWLQGPAPLGFDPNPEVLLGLGTILTRPSRLSPPGHAVYFRAHFARPSNAKALLVLTNRVNDGAVFYLNGSEVHRVRMPSDAVVHTTPASTSVAGAPEDVFVHVATNLVPGDNVLAVSVHQNPATSASVFFDAELWGETLSPALIIGQPQNLQLETGNLATFAVNAVGSLLAYQWQFNSQNILDATNAAYTLPHVQATDAGGYRCRVFNPVNAVTSQVVTLTVLPKTPPPQLVSAVAQDTASAPYYILVRFDERVSRGSSPNSGANRSNYIVADLGQLNRLVVSNAEVNASLVRLTVSPWQSNTSYILTVNNVTDEGGNPIAPNSRIGVAFLRPVIPLGARWNWCEDYDLTGQEWTSAHYDESTNEWFSGGQWVIPDPIWDPVGRAAFYFPVVSGYNFAGTANTALTFGRSCYYFRHPFVLPANSSAVGAARLDHLTDDGAVFYLNGQEIYRYNMPTSAVTYATLATSQRGAFADRPSFGVEVAVTNLVSGTNVLAVELHPASTAPWSEYGIAFDAALQVAVAPLLPPAESPIVAASPQLRVALAPGPRLVLTWDAVGCVVQAKSRVEDDWEDVPAAVSPHEESVGATRFYRLRCP